MRKGKAKLLAAVLFDLEKAFDKVDRARAFEVLAQKAGCIGLKLMMEEMHDGTCFMLKDAEGKLARRVVIKKGVRQGAVEGPLVFATT